MPGSKAVHLVPLRLVGDAWVHVPGWTFCGMEPGAILRDREHEAIAGNLCQPCSDWLDQICDLAYGSRPGEKPKGWPWRKKP